MTTTANGCGGGIAVRSKLQRMLEKATSLDEIRTVENLAQRARDYAKAAGLGRDSINSAARLALDARRKAGDTLNEMRKRGELAERGSNQHTRLSQPAMTTLEDLGFTPSQGSRYQQEASVPADVYAAWIQRVIASRDRVLTAGGLRALARQLGKSGGRDDPPLGFAAASSRIRRLVKKLWRQMGGDGRARLPKFLQSLSSQYEGDHDG
jgi:hypothetical protein